MTSPSKLMPMLSTLNRSSASTFAPPVLLLLTLFVLPLLINPAVTLSYDDVFLVPKAWWVLGAILPTSIYVLWTYRLGVPRWLWGLVGFWLAWCLLGFTLGERPELILMGIPNRLMGFPVYLTQAAALLGVCGWVRQSPEAPRQLMTVLAWLSAPLSLYAVAQYYGFLGVPGGERSTGVVALGVGSLIGHRGYLAGLLAVLLPLAASYSKHSQWGYLLVFLIAFAFAASLSRGPILGALAAYLYWLIIGRNWRVWGVHLALFSGGLATLPQLTSGQVNLRALGGTDGQNLADNSNRTILWNTALEGIRERPIFGWGEGQLINIMAARPDNVLVAEQKIDTAQQTVTRMPRQSNQNLGWRLSKPGQRDAIVAHTTNAVHNEYLEYALNFGVPAALAFVALLFLGIWRGRFVPWAGAAVLSYAVYLLTWPETLRFAPIAWAILGIALAGMTNPKSASAEKVSR